MTRWSGLDYLLAAILAISVLASFFRGFAHELISLGALLWGLILGLWFYGSLSPVFLPYVKTPEIASLAAFLAILVAALVAGAILAGVAARLVKKAGLRWFDRLLGASFGLVKGLLIGVALVLGLMVFPPGTGVVERSQLAPYMVLGARALVAIAPADLRARFHAGLEQVRKIWDTRPHRP